MTENVCVTCQYYESCNRPERFMKCMGYKEKQERGEENAQQTGRCCTVRMVSAVIRRT